MSLLGVDVLIGERCRFMDTIESLSDADLHVLASLVREAPHQCILHFVRDLDRFHLRELLHLCILSGDVALVFSLNFDLLRNGARNERLARLLGVEVARQSVEIGET